MSSSAGAPPLVVLDGSTPDAAGHAAPAVRRIVLRPVDVLHQPLPLVAGTEVFAADWLVDWHLGRHGFPPREGACFRAADVVFGAKGLLWIGGTLVADPSILPPYAAAYLGLPGRPAPAILASGTLPSRPVEEDCLVLTGRGLHVCGHFLVEALFRLLYAPQLLGARLSATRIALAGEPALADRHPSLA